MDDILLRQIVTFLVICVITFGFTHLARHWKELSSRGRYQRHMRGLARTLGTQLEVNATFFNGNDADLRVEGTYGGRQVVGESRVSDKYRRIQVWMFEPRLPAQATFLVNYPKLSPNIFWIGTSISYVYVETGRRRRYFNWKEILKDLEEAADWAVDHLE